MLRTCWFDEDNCATGIEGLRQYVKKAIEGAEDPDGNQMFSNEPTHNWASHPADAFRTGAMGSKADRSPSDPDRIIRPMSIV
jgi:phage terminase large subunit